MSLSFFGISLVVFFLLVVASVVAVASRRFGGEIILAAATLISLALAYAGLRHLFDSSDSNDIRGLIITVAGVVSLVSSGIVYAKILRMKEPKEKE